MASKQKEKEQDQQETKTVINNSVRPYVTSAGALPIGGSQTLPVKEADALLDYDGVVDAATYIPPGSAATKLKEDNEKLKTENAELKAAVVELETKVKELEALK